MEHTRNLFINNWLNELKNNYTKEKFTYFMSRMDEATGNCKSFCIEWKSDKHVQLINSNGGRCNTLSIETIKRLFAEYNGDEINYHKAGLYAYFSYLIPKLYTDYKFQQLSNSILNEVEHVDVLKNVNTEDINKVKKLMEIKKDDGTPYFHYDFLINKVLGIPMEYIESNKEFWFNDNHSNLLTEFEF